MIFLTNLRIIIDLLTQTLVFMKSTFFLENTLYCMVHQNPIIRDCKFTQKVHDMLGNKVSKLTLSPAFQCQTSNDSISSGVLVEIDSTEPSSLPILAELLKIETNQKNILVIVEGKSMPQGFSPTKTVQARLPPEIIPLSEVASLFYQTQIDFKKNKYFDSSVILYEDPYGIQLCSTISPVIDTEIDYWQTMMEKFLHSLSIMPKFSCVEAKVY